MLNKPEDLRYTKEHEWLKLDGDKAYVGLTKYAADQLGDVVHIELPQPDLEFERGASFGVVESVKSVSDMFIPVTGVVLEVNEELRENPGAINESPYNEGWVIKINLTNPKELEDLMSFEKYQAFLADEH